MSFWDQWTNSKDESGKENFFILAVFFILALAVIFGGCEGPAGPMGPAGPEGPQGPKGDPGEVVQQPETGLVQDPLIGTWVYDDDEDKVRFVWVFRETGSYDTFRFFNEEGKDLVKMHHARGIWERRGNQIALSIQWEGNLVDEDGELVWKENNDPFIYFVSFVVVGDCMGTMYENWVGTEAVHDPFCKTTDSYDDF